MEEIKKIYLDNAATTIVAGEVKKAMLPYLGEHYGNASSIHTEGRYAREAIEKARKAIAGFINAKEKEIIFTGSGTESNNTVLKGLASFSGREKNQIITSKIEHPSVIETCKFLEKEGFEIIYLGVDSNGLVNLEELEKKITQKTLLVSIMHANNEIGTIQNINKIGKICKNKEVLFHTDTVQTFGKIAIDVQADNIDFLSASAHKIYGPKGVGLLYIREGRRIEPLLHGGGHEFNIRSSTENVAGIVGFGKAVELCREKMEKESRRISRLRDYLIKELLMIPGTQLNGSASQRLYNNVNISFRGIEGESLVLQLGMRGIATSTGSACSTKNLEPSYVLSAIGLDHFTAHGSLRLTLGRNTSKKDILESVKNIQEVSEILRNISPIK